MDKNGLYEIEGTDSHIEIFTIPEESGMMVNKLRLSNVDFGVSDHSCFILKVHLDHLDIGPRGILNKYSNVFKYYSFGLHGLPTPIVYNKVNTEFLNNFN